MISCEKSNESKIWDAFQEYAKTNIDNPSSLEFVEIDSIDTLSTLKLKETLTDIYHYCDSMKKTRKYIDSIFFNCYLSEQNRIMLRNIPIKNDKEYVELWNALSKLVHDRQSINEQNLMFALQGDTIHSFIYDYEYKNLMHLKDTTFCTQRLSYRFKDNNGKHLKRMYVICDTLYNNFKFVENKDNLPNEYAQLLLKIDNYTDKCKIIFDMELENIEILNSLIHLLENRYGIKIEYDKHK